jgi:hypothetical protein
VIFRPRVTVNDGDQAFLVVMLEYLRSREYTKPGSYTTVPVGGNVHFTNP